MTEKQIEKMMKALDCSREEAIEVILEDEAVDKMSMKEVSSDLTAEQKKVVKEVSKTGTRKTSTVYKFDTKKKKKDDEKIEIVKKIYDFVAKFTKNCTISNENREITFDFGENSYSLVLTKHRKPKNQLKKCQF